MRQRPILTETRIEAELEDLIATLNICQTFENKDAINIEAVFSFPVPLDAVLLDFTMTLGERRLKGVIIEKHQAQDRYEEAITDGDRAVMIEEVKPGLFTVNVGNLQPGERLVARYGLAYPLRWQEDTIRLRIPTTIAPRYGAPSLGGFLPHQEPKHSLTKENRCSIEVLIKGLFHHNKVQVYCPTHAVEVTREKTMTSVRLLDGTTVMDRDFVIELKEVEGPKASVTSQPDLKGTVAHASFCPNFGYQKRLPICLKVLVDCSGSMNGDSIGQAKVALGHIIETLEQGDTFSITAFGNDHRHLFNHIAPATPGNVAIAHAFLDGLAADMGGTEMGAALDAIYSLPGTTDGADVLLITDGEVYDDTPIVEKARQSMHRIFSVGVGSAVAEDVVRGLSDTTGGSCELVTPNEEMGAKIYRHFLRITSPRARQVTITWPAESKGQIPTSLEGIFSGESLHVFAQFTKEVEGDVVLKAELGDGKSIQESVRIVPSSSLYGEGSNLGHIAKLAASRRIHDEENKDQKLKIALEYQLMTRLTNCLLVDELDESQRAKDLPELRKVAHTLAAGWHGFGTTKQTDLEIPSFCRAQSSRARMTSLISTQGGRAWKSMQRGSTHTELVFKEDDFDIPDLIKMQCEKKNRAIHTSKNNNAKECIKGNNPRHQKQAQNISPNINNPETIAEAIQRYIEGHRLDEINLGTLHEWGLAQKTQNLLDGQLYCDFDSTEIALIWLAEYFRRNATSKIKYKNIARHIEKYIKNKINNEIGKIQAKHKNIKDLVQRVIAREGHIAINKV